MDLVVLGVAPSGRPAPYLFCELRVIQILDGLLPHLPEVAEGVDLAGHEVLTDGSW